MGKDLIFGLEYEAYDDNYSVINAKNDIEYGYFLARQSPFVYLAITSILDVTYAKFVSGEAYFYTENISLLKFIFLKDKFDDFNDYLIRDQADKIWGSDSTMDDLDVCVESWTDIFAAEPRGDLIDDEPIQGIDYR